MRKEDRLDFLKGLKKKMAEMELNQVNFANLVGVSAVTVSRWFSPNTEDFPSDESLEKVCSALGMTEDDIIAIVNPPKQVRTKPPTVVSIPSDYMAVDDVVQTLSTVSASFIKADARLKFWGQLIEALPMPVMVVRDGIIYVQNRASRAIWIGIGKPLRESCHDPRCKEVGHCDIEVALDSSRDIERYKKLGDDYYKVVTGHFSANNHNYNVVVITEINECYVNSERLATIQEERNFLSNNLFETPGCYFNTHGKVSYVNKSFMKLFEIDKKDIQTSDDLHIMLSRKLFYLGHVSKAIDDARDNGKPIEVQAKLKNNKTINFILTPHVVDGVSRGVLVVCLTAELYACLKEANL